MSNRPGENDNVKFLSLSALVLMAKEANQLNDETVENWGDAADNHSEATSVATSTRYHAEIAHNGNKSSKEKQLPKPSATEAIRKSQRLTERGSMASAVSLRRSKRLAEREEQAKNYKKTSKGRKSRYRKRTAWKI
ncbi:hypothetical protein LX32DRAFT_645850 [Colletotrichum zoysiae]|uniref:Uncharacterized protein n=1 Tax=Colletotrichum zoysiae TaxID=1216348 RepID=A0AAD9LXT1_9PEZI|nr:hypothetical protein LX32DRAFT_645850 [Colletotrichum zoysiae]